MIWNDIDLNWNSTALDMAYVVLDQLHWRRYKTNIISIFFTNADV